MSDETAGLTLADLEYELPDELIAQTPVEPRDASRLLVERRATGALEDRVFSELPSLLREGDVLVRNDTRVFPARSFFHRATGGRIEVLFLCALTGPSPAGERWEALLRGRPRREEVLESEAMGPEWPLRCIEPLGDGRWVVESLGPAAVLELLADAGVTPLPPYITTPLEDPERYQTTYSCALGSAAAPTAGLHFTPELDAALVAAGVSLEQVTLHVGLGTFKPLSEGPLEAATLHSESFTVEPAVWARLQRGAPGRPPHRRRRHDLDARAGAPGGRRTRPGTGRGAPERRHPPLHPPGLPVPHGRRARDQLPSAAHEPAGARDGVLRRGGDARRLPPRRGRALPLLQLRRRDAGAVNSRRSEAVDRRDAAAPVRGAP